MNHERKGNWFFALVRALMGCVLLAAAVGAGIYFWLDHKANKRWAEVEAMLTREGETLKFMDLLPMRMPEAENFAAMEELRDIATVVDGDDQKGEPAEKRKALAKMREGMELLRSSRGDRLTGKLPDWAGLARELHSGHVASPAMVPKPPVVPLLSALPAPGLEAVAIHRALEDRYPLIKKLGERAMHYTLAQMVPPLREIPPPKSLVVRQVPHFNALNGCAKALTMHGLAAAEAGQGGAAVGDVCALLLLAQCLEDDPSLIANLVSTTDRMMALDTLWQIFATPQGLAGVGEQELGHLQSLLAQIHVDQGFLNAMRGELIVGAQMMDLLAASREGRSVLGAESLVPEAFPYRFIDWLPASVFELNKASLAEAEFDFVMAPLKRGVDLRKDLVNAESLTAALEPGGSRWIDLERAFARLVVPTVNLMVRKNAQMEVGLQQALLACALERYFLKHGGYPAELGALVPAFLPELPADSWAVGAKKPMGYRQTANGRYMIWSVGPDGRDDGGVVNFKSPEAPRGKDLLEEGYKGDWTWQYGQGD